MAEFQPSQYLIAIVIFSMLSLAGISFMSEMRASNPTFSNSTQMSELSNTFDKIEEINNRTNQYNSLVATTDNNDFNIFGFFIGLIIRLMQGIKNMVESMNFMDVVFKSGLAMIGLPTWVSAAIITIITIAISFALINMFMRRGGV